jgi:hypothetical protein
LLYISAMIMERYLRIGHAPNPDVFTVGLPSSQRLPA